MILSRFLFTRSATTSPRRLAMFDRERLVVETNATIVTTNAGDPPLLPEHIDRFGRCWNGERQRYRAVALRYPRTAFRWSVRTSLFGTRSDDPTTSSSRGTGDLRGLQVFSAWLNHAHGRAPHV